MAPQGLRRPAQPARQTRDCSLQRSTPLRCRPQRLEPFSLLYQRRSRWQRPCPSYGASKRYRSKCQACNGYRPRNNQPRERKSLAGREKDGKGKGSPCEMHSYLGRPAKHEWAECSESPANQKKPAAKCAEAYYAHDERHPVSDAASLSKHHTVLASDKSSKRYSSRSDHFDDEDNNLPSPSRPCLASKPSAMYYLLKGS